MELKELKKYQPIYVIGHRKPDIDTIVSSKILADILNSYGINSKYAVIEGEMPDEYNMKMITECMDYSPVVVKEKDISNHNYFLVDHNDVSQSVKKASLVVGAIDHHPDSGNIKNLIITDYCCTALYLFELFNEYEFSEEQKYQIYLAFLNDSSFTKSSRFQKKDGELASKLGFDYDYKEMFKKFFIPTDLGNNHDEVFLKHGHKQYIFPNYQFESSYIERFDTMYMDEYKEFIKNYQGNFLGLWINYDKDKTYVFFKYNGKIHEKIYDVIASRATTVLNDVLDFLEGKTKKLV